MHSPALAIAWQLWTRHRSGIVIALVSLVAMLAASPLLPLASRVITTSIVLILVIAYFMHILLFVSAVGSLGSTYPRQMYSLPVSSRTLVAWPMLYGGGVVALLWVAGACLVFRPSGFQTPILLPALGLAATLVWLQVFAWSPISNHLLNLYIPLTFIPLLLAVPVRMLWLWRGGFRKGVVDPSSFDALLTSSLDALLTRITEPVVWTLLLIYIPLAYFVARAGVGSDRKGDTWRVLPQGLLHTVFAPRRVQSRPPFRSPAGAQTWYEWDCNGLLLPVVGAASLLLVLGATTLGQGSFPEDFAGPLAMLMILPVSFAGAVSLSLGSLRPFWDKSPGFITFLATRPLGSGAIVAAKLRMVALSILLLFVIMGIEILLWIVIAGHTPEVLDLARRFLGTFPGWRAPAVLVLGVVTVPALVWSMATAGFPVALVGRNAVLVGVNLAVIAAVMGFGAAVIGLTFYPAYLARVIALCPWLVLSATVVKGIVATLAFRACLHCGLMRMPTAIAIVASALVVAASAVALANLLSAAELIPWPMSINLLAIVILVPCGRLALAPLALEWNRHR